MIEFKPCPFCGDTHIDVMLDDDKYFGRVWYVRCHKCRVRTPSIPETMDTHQDREQAYDQIKSAVERAANTWNHRVSDKE